MGRRALRKLDPELDLTGYLYTLDTLPRPCDPQLFYGRQAPWEIEVGSGKGLFLQTACEAFPERNFLGIELAARYARFCAGRLAREQLTNGRVVSGDAIRLFREWLPEQSVAAVHVYFPDPWWKKRHHKRRVMNGPFVQRIERVLQIGGLLHFWTDVEEYFAASVALLKDVTLLSGPEEVVERPASHTLDYRTHFERRTRLQSQPVYRALFRRTTADVRPPVSEDHEVSAATPDTQDGPVGGNATPERDS